MGLFLFPLLSSSMNVKTNSVALVFWKFEVRLKGDSWLKGMDGSCYLCFSSAHAVIPVLSVSPDACLWDACLPLSKEESYGSLWVCAYLLLWKSMLSVSSGVPQCMQPAHKTRVTLQRVARGSWPWQDGSHLLCGHQGLPQAPHPRSPPPSRSLQGAQADKGGCTVCHPRESFLGSFPIFWAFILSPFLL